MELLSFEYLHLQALFKSLIVQQETLQTGKNTSVQERFVPDRPQITHNKQASCRGKWGELGGRKDSVLLVQCSKSRGRGNLS